MKKLFTIFILSIIAFTGFGQSKSYWSSGGEMLFSFANIKDNGVSESSSLRWAPVINLQGTYNHDLNPNVGIFTGLFCRNVGYIYDNYTDRTVNEGEFTGTPHKMKFRSYNVGLPVGIKIGNLENLFFYGGYEIEIPVRYKEKTFDGSDKTNTTTGWFSDRQELFQHGFMAGVQFPYGFNLKFKYYLSEFHNQDYVNNAGIKPYSGLESHVMYFSLGYNLQW